ncbi:STM4014 family protein [Streptomyces sp. SL13]|uniref:STM4014 family protein n=1 Tax=Streptantibioticus silvisoli TaxID=2705255 RepID=A0AA90H3D8_9ACTN|nr:STM4014 family protein [Streptantibioticus silvisoli]MDI5969985.1 STM4014 family protein [Streptantibioticus silvisoli]
MAGEGAGGSTVPAHPFPVRPASSTSAVRFAVVGNPGSRRVELFRAAVVAAGSPVPEVVAWRDVVRGTDGAGPAPGTLVRIDSPGEDAEVDRLLRGDALGEGFAPARVEGGAAWFARFTAALRQVTARAAERGCPVLADAAEIAVMFDKRRTHAVLSAAGVPVPPALDQGGRPIEGWEDLRERLAAAGMTRAFVKPAHGSSASGVTAVEIGPRGRARATTSAELAAGPDGSPVLFNSLKVRRYTEEVDLRALFGALARDPSHVERWLPKAAQAGRAADLRVVVTAGRPTHAVVRTSRHPMTNLHLGGARGDLDAVRALAGPAWRDALETCERVAALFPRSLSIGVDLLPATGWRRYAVGEVNAFGDLLPRLTGLPGSGAEGLDTYGAFIAAARHAPAAGTSVSATARTGTALAGTPLRGTATTSPSTVSPPGAAPLPAAHAATPPTGIHP